MKHILLFGAGKSATVLIDYLVANAEIENWHITIADAQQDLIEAKTKKATCTTAVAIDVNNATDRLEIITASDIVISLLPPHLHILVAKDCLAAAKNLLTASYVSEEIKLLEEEVNSKGLLFLCEMGLDPGIDHMSAMQMIDEIHSSGGKITAFASHCGGLVAPESDNNPWHYKISWNPRNVVLAGKAGAVFTKFNQVVEQKYEQLFEQQHAMNVDDLDIFCYYPNRDSLPYIQLYGLQHCHSFLRTTIRPLEFMYGWKNIIDLKLTAEDQFYNTEGLSIASFFHQHFESNGFSDWITQQLMTNLSSVGDMLKQTMLLLDKEDEMKAEGNDDRNFLVVDDSGKLQNVNVDDAKLDAAQNMVMRLYENNLLLKQLFYLGMDDTETIIDRGQCSAADVLQFILEKKLPLLPQDKDMVVMQHEMKYEIGENKFFRKATLVLEGEDGIHTAMAKTVGLPLGIAVRLILNKKIDVTGIQIPITKEIYEPVLRELAVAGIEFVEKTEIL